MASKKCKKCKDFTILREPNADKIGVVICEKYGMVLGYLLENQLEGLNCGDRLNSLTSNNKLS